MLDERRPYIVFGYGSLIFKPPPHVVKESPGYLKGYVRRFAQKSHDHRGTPENPGRVVTLIHKEDWDNFSASDSFPHEDVVWDSSEADDCGIQDTETLWVREGGQDYRDADKMTLDYREKDGYTLEEVDIHGLVDGHENIILPKTFCYVGRPDNPSFLGSEPIDKLAERIWHSVGPSGPNKEYLYKLAESVRRLAPESHDSHLFALETRCRELDQKARAGGLGSIHEL